MLDGSESVAPLYLLIKDHKGWLESSNTPPPSRPVCSRIRGFNKHLSELVSPILEPITHLIKKLPQIYIKRENVECYKSH